MFFYLLSVRRVLQRPRRDAGVPLRPRVSVQIVLRAQHSGGGHKQEPATQVRSGDEVKVLLKSIISIIGFTSRDFAFPLGLFAFPVSRGKRPGILGHQTWLFLLIKHIHFRVFSLIN
jgi:hypothetical protein